MKALGISQPNEFYRFGIRAVFQTRGKFGCAVYTKNNEDLIPSVQPEKVVDPTGAGDTFVGVTSAFLSKGTSELDAARAGVTASSFIVEGWGCQTAIPTIENFKERYSQNFQDSPLLKMDFLK